MASSIPAGNLRIPQSFSLSPPRPTSQLVVPPSSSSATTSLVRSPLTAASVRSREFSHQSDVVRSCVVARASASDVGPDISDALGNVRIFTASGRPVMFKDLWDQNEGMAVVALLQHFGCPCCWELASALKESKAKFDSAGVKLIAVGVGTPDKARILAERTASRMIFWACIMVSAAHSSILQVQRSFPGSMLFRKLWRITQLKPLQMTEVVFCNRWDVCLQGQAIVICPER